MVATNAGNANNASLELEAVDFGPIVHGALDLRPLTVFVGPSNTGKSYLAVLIYALHLFFSGGPLFRRSRLSRPVEGAGARPRRVDIEATLEWVEAFVGDGLGDGRTEIGAALALPTCVTEAIQAALGLEGERMGVELGRCFGADASELARKPGSGRARFQVRRLADREGLESAHSFDFLPEAGNLTARLADGVHLELGHREQLELEMLLRNPRRTGGSGGGVRQQELLYRRVVSELTNLALPQLVGPLHRPAHYLPADRTGVMHAHSVVVGALIDSAPMAGIRPPTRASMLSGVLADFLERLIQIDAMPRTHRWAGHGRADRLESAILGGAVQIERGATSGYPSFRYRPDGWRGSLSLMNASSMVSELAPVVLYLRHLVGPGELLIVEEPESHLHPSMQVEFTRQLAALVMDGVQVLLTTHSEWVLEELSNIVLAADVPMSQRKSLPGGDVALGAHEVGVWTFRQKARPKGTVVEEVRLAESGDVYSAGFDEVSTETHNKWVDLGNLGGRSS